MATTFDDIIAQLPSPPLSPYFDFECFDEDNKNEKEVLCSPVESSVDLSENNILRNQFMNMMEEGVQINGELIPYPYAIEKLRSIGNKVINKKTKDAIYLRVYELDKDNFEEYWVQPMFLSLQSFQFYKLFEEVKNNNEQGTIEIEVPSLQTFRYILYWLYTGDLSKLLDIARNDESFCTGVVENVKFLEINMASY